MPKEILRLGVLAQLRPPVTRWSSGELRPLMVLPAEPAAAPGTRLSSEDGVETWYLGGRDLVLWSGDASHHQDNLNSGRPSVWVALRGTDPARAEVIAVTVDPYEGEGLASDPELIVDAVPMPEPIARSVAAFARAHFFEMPFKKRQRQSVDPNAMSSRAPRILQPEDKWETRKGRRSDP
ncbi:MAG: DUF3305 domain-containing protein [Proteobacteria bacterium]|nr:DUF3305 domain-containing protein [Pseudomonadota bacterium]